MKIIEPRVEFVKEKNPVKKIELCGRVCYKSEDRITEDSAEKFVKGIIKSGHTSVLEHSRVYLPAGSWSSEEIGRAESCYGFLNRTNMFDVPYIAVNARDIVAMGKSIEFLSQLQDADDYMTVRFVCDRGISHELVRHRVFSFSQESTRYVKYDGGAEFIIPFPFEWASDKNNSVTKEWFDAMCFAEKKYIKMMQLGVKAQEARSVLPNSIKTEVVMTGTFNQWNEMLKLRIDNAAHPQMRYLMEMMVNHADCPEEISLEWQDKCVYIKQGG